MKENNVTCAQEVLTSKMTLEYSVSEIAHAIRNLLDDNLRGVRIRGEIVGLKVHPSGHIYFTLKDANAVLKAVCWKAIAAKLPITLEDGMEVVCIGSISSYINGSYYQIIVDKVEIAGVGALLAMLEERKKKFQKEGLFEHKKSLPFLPRIIGIVTSPTGAVIHDILHRLQDRFPVHVLVWGVAVQGEGAAAQIAHAIEGFNNMPESTRPNLLIVARGGGSIEDLWPFNEEIVVRAAASSSIPLISAVGHETDTTLIDYASDRRAPTPTAAAEMAVPVHADLQFSLENLKHGLNHSMLGLWERKKLYLAQYEGKLNTIIHLFADRTQRIDQAQLRLTQALKNLYFSKAQKLQQLRYALHPNLLLNNLNIATQRLSILNEKIETSINQLFHKREEALRLAEKMILTLSYKQTMKRGFSLVKNEKNQLVKSINSLKPNQVVSIEMYDGVKNAVIYGDQLSKKKNKSSFIIDQLELSL